jgi:hypothetical protein
LLSKQIARGSPVASFPDRRSAEEYEQRVLAQAEKRGIRDGAGT